MSSLKGRVAVVTGASEGIGAAIVRRLAAEGVKVAALARRIDKLTDLEKELREKGYTVNGYLCDVQRESSVKDAFDRIEEDFGGIHLLVNNAATGALVNMLDINMENTAAILNTNVYGAMSCIKEALTLMKNHSIHDGHIVNINSISGHRAPVREDGGVYGASKHALRVLTESLRTDIIKHKLKTRVTSISPGMVRTSMTDYFRKLHPDWPTLIAENIADALVYAITVPSNVNISEMIIDPV
ncbi:farnesol dehydrogenase [Halyomorpha halys]|uniref:farnesol dehydrogenase n=1 Tax=Halyomorpha halys TaxID=286706 RepID=UPI0006D4FB1E|nr:farnesol dehydrogenase-like [Halyomorpha halys]